ncbi:MAG: phytoene desaturase family protein [Geminicoccaceae bacterium]|nr:phytoene desaturase family protein [Geminicoccaceae bacterium]
MPAREPRILVVGAGAAGLAAALELAHRGCAVGVLERAGGPGGKMRALEVGGRAVAAGPTVLTLRFLLDELLAAVGTRLEAELAVTRAEILARHAWPDGSTLDLFADPERSEAAIAAFAGAAEARRFRAFRAEAARIWAILEQPFLRAIEPSLPGLLGGVGLRGLAELPRIRPFESMWKVLGEHFRDPRLRQLFARYATYCGGSPFLAPATLVLVIHAELEGVWLLEGGLPALARTLARLAEARGAVFRYESEVAEILIEGGATRGVRLASGERLEADAVIVNADIAALATGRFGPAAVRAVEGRAPGGRSLSAVVWTVVGRAAGFPLVHHDVFFSADYPGEFTEILERHRLPSDPTVYLCAQDRPAAEAAPPAAEERFLLLVNAPATGDRHPFPEAEIAACWERVRNKLERAGLRIEARAMRATTPRDFAELFPVSGGALYGPAPHGWRAAFARQAVRTRLPGLYCAGGTVHPGPGVPMAILSGRQAARAVLADLASTRRSRPAAIAGGISTR